MKVVIVNASPRAKGNTALASQVVARELEQHGVAAEIIRIGSHPVAGCVACGGCAGGGGCILKDEKFAAWADAIHAADGAVFATPVYFAGMNGTLKAFLDRVFSSAKGARGMRHKVGAALAVARRAAAMSAFDEINRYFLISEMLIAPSFYWNVAYGSEPGEIERDPEGLATFRNMARNMAWMLKMKEATRETLPPPAPYENRPRTNFIR